MLYDLKKPIFFTITETREVIKADGTVVHEVTGVATAQKFDRDGERCIYDDTKPLYEAWSKSQFEATQVEGMEPSMGNVRLQHTMEIAGKVTGLVYDDHGKRILAKTEPRDETIWGLIQRGMVTGFSQAGKYAYRKCATCGGDLGEPGNFKCDNCNAIRRCDYACYPAELSYVDRPCLGDSTFTHIKADGSHELRKFAAPVVAKSKTKRVAGEDLSSSAFAYVGDADDPSTWKLPIRFSSDTKSKSHIRNALSRLGQTDLPDDVKSKVRSRITSAARHYGITVSGSKSDGGTMVRKDMYSIGYLSEVLQRIKYLQNSSRAEGDYEEDDEDLAIAEELGQLLADGADILKHLVEHETSELTAAQKAAFTQKGDGSMLELFKAARKSLQSHFTKAASHHEAMAEFHKGLAEEHAAALETHKSAMEECDGPMKAFHKAMGNHHKALGANHLKLSKAHTAHATHQGSMAAAHAEQNEKAESLELVKTVTTTAPAVPVATKTETTTAPAPAPAPAATTTGTEPDPTDIAGQVKKMVGTTFMDMFKATVAEMPNDPEVKKMLQAAVAGQIGSILGQQVVPSAVKVAGATLVGRNGETLNANPAVDENDNGL